MRIPLVPVHGPLVAAMPAVVLWARNRGQIDFFDAIVAAAGLALVASAAIIAAWPWGRDRAGIVGLIVGAAIGWSGLVVSRVLIPVSSTWVLVGLMAGAAGAVVLVSRQSVPRDVTKVLNLMAVALLVVPVALGPSAAGAEPMPPSGLDVRGAEGAPGVVHVVLDGYPSRDILQEVLGIDNGPFLEDLESMGFEMLDAVANYPMTLHSLASLLAADHLHGAGAGRDLDPLEHWIGHAPVAKAMQDVGLRTVITSSYFEVADWDHPAWDQAVACVPPRFQRILERFTIAGAGRDLVDHARQQHVAVECALDVARGAATDAYTFVHILPPHPPLIYDADGNLRATSASERGQWDDPALAGQLAYVNDVVVELAQGLLDRGLVVIITGDHGSARIHGADDPDGLPDNPSAAGLRERYSVLAAVAGADIQPHSLVNIYPMLFGSWGADVELRPDESYYATYRDPWDFQRVEVRQSL